MALLSKKKKEKAINRKLQKSLFLNEGDNRPPVLPDLPIHLEDLIACKLSFAAPVTI